MMDWLVENHASENLKLVKKDVLDQQPNRENINENYYN
jgi:hypothetical protein